MHSGAYEISLSIYISHNHIFNYNRLFVEMIQSAIAVNSGANVCDYDNDQIMVSSAIHPGRPEYVHVL